VIHGILLLFINKNGDLVPFSLIQFKPFCIGWKWSTQSMSVRLPGKSSKLIPRIMVRSPWPGRNSIRIPAKSSNEPIKYRSSFKRMNVAGCSSSFFVCSWRWRKKFLFSLQIIQGTMSRLKKKVIVEMIPRQVSTEPY